MATQFKPYLDTSDMYSALAVRLRNEIKQGNSVSTKNVVDLLKALDIELAKQGEP